MIGDRPGPHTFADIRLQPSGKASEVVAEDAWPQSAPCDVQELRIRGPRLEKESRHPSAQRTADSAEGRASALIGGFALAYERYADHGLLTSLSVAARRCAHA